MRTWSCFLLLLLAALPAVPAEDLPLPPGSRKIEALSGATTLAPGKNYTRTVHETDEGFERVVEFYQRSLAATATREGDAVSFSTGRGTVRLSPLGTGTRITRTVGPQ